jgi:cytochrome c-type protein NapC
MKPERHAGFKQNLLLNLGQPGFSIISSTFLTLIFSCIAPTANAADIDWGQVESTTVKVFYPGVASWDFMTGKDHGTGGNVVKKLEKACADCHVGKDGSYDIKSDKIISGELKMVDSGDPLEPDPGSLSGMSGFKDVTVQAAYDAENIYLRVQWPGSGASVSKEDADKVSFQVSDKIKSFSLYGCFISCHDDETGMPDNRGEKKTLYGYYAAGKPQDKLDGFLSKGQFIDLWEAYFVGTEVKTEDEYVLEARHEDKNDLAATGSFEGGKYTVVITRKLNTGDKGDLGLKDGKSFSAGISIHDNKNKDRKHYTSFPVTIGLSASGDIKAKKF